MSLIRLFHMAVPGRIHSRAFRCAWVLHELDVKNFEIFMLTPGQPYAPQMRAQGVRYSTKVPTLLINGQEISDSGVICRLLAEEHQSTLNLLGNKEEHLETMQWMGFAETCVSLRVPLMGRRSRSARRVWRQHQFEAIDWRCGLCRGSLYSRPQRGPRQILRQYRPRKITRPSGD